MIRSSYRPAGGTWGGTHEVLVNNYPDTMQERLMVEFDGLGRTVALAKFREFVDTVRVNVGTGGGWGPKDQVLDANSSHDVRGVHALVRHPQGRSRSGRGSRRRATSTTTSSSRV